MEAEHVPAWLEMSERLYSRVLAGARGIGQCVVEMTIHSPGEFTFLSKIGVVTAFDCYYAR